MFQPHKLTAWDALQLLTKRFSDQQVRMVVELDGRLDDARLAEAVRVVVEAEPVLACRVRERFFRPVWTRIPDLDPQSLIRIVAGANPGDEILRLIVEDLDPRQGPVLKVGLVRGERDALVVNLDHTAGDAASVRSLAYLLASAYSHPERFSAPDRRAYFAKRRFQSLWPLLPETGRGRRPPMPPPPARPSWRFPWGNDAADVRKRLLIRRLEPTRAEAVRQFAASRGAWLNDVFLAAYFRVLAALVGEGTGVARLTVPVDMRSYLPARERPRIANFSASFEAALEDGVGRSFEETLGLVRAATEKERNGRPGLGQAAALSALADRVPYRLIKYRFDKGRVGMTLPPPWFIALGVLRPESLSFGSVAARHAHSLQSFGRAGLVFQLSVSSFRESFTLAVCFVGSGGQEEVVTRFLDAFETELPS
jgi:NRPS condensation-like uncharacterized protein